MQATKGEKQSIVLWPMNYNGQYGKILTTGAFEASVT